MVQKGIKELMQGPVYPVRPFRGIVLVIVVVKPLFKAPAVCHAAGMTSSRARHVPHVAT